jgi:hypothetical protein
MFDLSGYQVTSALVVLALVASATTGVCASTLLGTLAK